MPQWLTDILQIIKPVPLQNQWLTDILQTIKLIPLQNQWLTDILQTIKLIPFKLTFYSTKPMVNLPLQNQWLTDILQTIKLIPLQNQWLTNILQTIKPVPSQNQWFTTQPIHLKKIHIHFDFKLSVLVNTHLSTNKQHTNKQTKNMEPSKCLSKSANHYNVQ